MTCRPILRSLAPAGLALLTLLVSGCGQKGPLVLPDRQTTTPVNAQTTPPPTNTQP